MTNMMAKYGVKPEQLAAVAPVLGQFLQHRMGPDGQAVIGKVLPMLTSGQAQGALGGIASMLGGLFGKK